MDAERYQQNLAVFTSLQASIDEEASLRERWVFRRQLHNIANDELADCETRFANWTVTVAR